LTVDFVGENQKRVSRLGGGAIALAAGLGTLAVPYGDSRFITTYTERSGCRQ
jgi:hypothetical protein